jgi:tRNA(Ile)-lysidine synthase TilS/MesJ
MQIKEVNFSLSAMKAYRESRGKDPLILDLAISWKRSQLHVYEREHQYPLNKRFGGTHSPYGRFRTRACLFSLPGLEPRAVQLLV